MGKAGKMILMHLLFGECARAEPINAGCSHKNECVPVIILKDGVFFADCDINGDDHCLLGVIECAMCNAAILALIHHCHASV